MDVYTRVEAAEYLKVSPSAVHHYITDKRLAAFKKGKTWLIWASDLEQFQKSEWFQNRQPGLKSQRGEKSKYPVDMPRRHLFEHHRKKEKRDDQKG